MMARYFRVALLGGLLATTGLMQAGFLEAQQRGSSQGVRSRPSRPSSNSSPSVRSRPARTTVSGVRPIRSTTVDRGSSQNSAYYNWRREQLLRARTYGYPLSGRGFDSFSGFCNRLYLDYGYPFWRIRPSFDRYAIGDVGITPEMASLSLRPSLERAQELRRAAEQVVRLVDDYSARSITQEAFELEAEKELKSIRKLAKQIRKDFYVGYLDQGRDAKNPLPPQANSLADLRAQAALLQRWSQDVENRLQDHREVTRTVSLDSLETTSAQATARDLEALAKSLYKATRALPVDSTG